MSNLPSARSAKAKGVRFGRPTKAAPEDFAGIVEDCEAGRRSFEEFVCLCGMSESTFYRRLREYRLVHKVYFLTKMG